MLYAMNNATEQYKSKGVINENTKLYSQKSTIDFKQKIKLKKNRSQIDLFENKNKNKDDIIYRYGNIMNVEKEKMFNEVEKEYKSLYKMEMSKLLIKKEGSYTNNYRIIYSNGSVNNLQNDIITTDKVKGLPFDLQDEEDRELRAINGYNEQYKRNIKY